MNKYLKYFSGGTNNGVSEEHGSSASQNKHSSTKYVSIA